MARGSVGTRTGGKGSWRRKAKRIPAGGNQQGQKVWQAALRAGCRNFGDLDSAAMLFGNDEEALHFAKPELALDMRSNTFVLMGKPEKKSVSEVFTDFLSSFDFSKLAKAEKKEGEEKDDLGDVPENVDFAKPEESGETA